MKSRQCFVKVPARGVHLQGKIRGMSSRLTEYFPEHAEYSFYKCIQNSCFAFSFFIKLVHGNTESISRTLCNTQTLKLSPTSC